MVTNVGSTSLQLNSFEDEPFIDKAKYAMKMLVEKKVKLFILFIVIIVCMYVLYIHILENIF